MNPAIVKMQRRGNSLAVTIPRPMLHALQWREGQYLEVRLTGEVIEMQAVIHRITRRGHNQAEIDFIDPNVSQV